MRGSHLVVFAILFCLGHASSTWATASPPKPNCIGTDPKLKEILSHFSWRSNDPQLKADACDPKNLAYRVAHAVLNLAAVDIFQSKSTHLSGYEVLSSGPFQFFSSRIQTFVFEREGQCGSIYLAYVSGVGDGTMHICPRLEKYDDLTIMSTLVHEARHQDGYPHTTCNHGFFAGNSDSATCDASYSSGGAYSVETLSYILFSRLDQLDPSLRQFARAKAIQNLMERFNALPLGIQRGAVLVSDNSQVLFYNGKTTVPLHPLTQPKTRLIKMGGILNFYEPAKNLWTALADGMNLNPNPLPLGSEARNLIDQYQQIPADCSLFSNQVTCEFQNNQVTLPIADFTPIGFWTYDPMEQTNPTVYIASKEQRVYAFNQTSKAFARKKLTPFKNVSTWNEERFITLGFDGRVLFIETDPKATQPYVSPPGLDPDDKFIQMITPYYWSKELQAL